MKPDQILKAPLSDLPQIFDDLFTKKELKVISVLCRDPKTKGPLLDYVSAHLPQIEAKDPEFQILSVLADEFDGVRQQIMDFCIPKLQDSPKPLNVLGRLLANDKLTLTFENLQPVLQYINCGNEKWHGLALVIARSSITRYSEEIVKFVQNNQTGYKVIAGLVDALPSLADKALDFVDQVDTHSDLPNCFWDMLSAVCNNPDQRLKLATKVPVFPAKLSAQVVYAKILAGTTSQSCEGDLETVLAKLDNISKRHFEDLEVENDDSLEYKLEGLVCTCNLPLVQARASQKLISKLVSIIKSSITKSYAVLVILYNLTLYPFPLTDKLRQNTKLRIQAMGKNLRDLSLEQYTQQNLVEISLQNVQYLINTDFIHWVVQNLTRLTPPTHVETAKLAASISSHNQKVVRDQLAKQNLVVVVLFLYTTTKDAVVKQLSASCVAKILASSPPGIALPSQVQVTTLLTPIISQVDNTESAYPTLDTFEALRALTNLSSGEDMKVRAIISMKIRPQIPQLIESDTLMITRSALELMCNLMLDPITTEDLKANSSECDRLLSLLVIHSLDQDKPSRLASTGALAILSETQPQIVGKWVPDLKKAQKMYPQDQEMALRVNMCIENAK